MATEKQYFKKYDIENEKWDEHPVNSLFSDNEPSMSLMHSSVVRQLANARVGTASTLTRAEVRGGGKKPWRQKGTGRARAGSTRSPLWRGGGIAFGPKPRDYDIKMPKKMRKLALQGAVSTKVSESVIISGLNKLEPKTAAFIKFLESINIKEGKILLIVDTDYPNIYLATGNLRYVRVINASNVGVYDLLKADYILYTEQSLPIIEGRATVC